jgi:hypothetical protein
MKRRVLSWTMPIIHEGRRQIYCGSVIVHNVGLDRARHIGSGPKSYRIGRRVFYLSQDMDAWHAEQMTAMQSAAGLRPLNAIPPSESA